MEVRRQDKQPIRYLICLLVFSVLFARSISEQIYLAHVCCQHVEDQRVTNVWFRYLFLCVYSVITGEMR